MDTSYLNGIVMCQLKIPTNQSKEEVLMDVTCIGIDLAKASIPDSRC